MADASTPAPSITLDPNLIWEVATEFIGCGYSLYGAPPLIRPGYPERFLDDLKGRNRNWTYLEKHFRGAWDGRHYTNCCMFVEAVLIGSALRSPQADRLDWGKVRHDWANIVVSDKHPGGKAAHAAELVRMCSSLKAYEDAGLARMAGVDEEPSDWCVCQGFRNDSGAGHTFIIMAYEGGQCLTLEANLFDHKQSNIGYVGHRDRSMKKPILLADRPPAKAVWRASAPTWEQIKKSYPPNRLRFARLNVGPSERPSLPFDRREEAFAPTRYFFLNEAKTVGGYYPLGAFQNIHGGVHLSADDERAREGVRCLAPGYVVALRQTQAMPADPHDTATKAAKSAADARELSGNHNGFVLVRHQVATIPRGAEPKETFTFYSLYMHLAPPRWGDARDPYARVPWVRTIGQCHGAVVDVTPKSPTFLKHRYLDAAPPSYGPVASGEFGVYLPDALSPGGRFKTPPVDGVVATAVLRPPDEDIKQAHDALVEEHGRVVTFTAPLVPVDAGEVLGVVAPDSALSGGFLHWEVLGPAGADHGLKAFVEFAEKALAPHGAGLFQFFEEKTPDNYLDPEKDGPGGDLHKVLERLQPDLPGGRDVATLLRDEYDLLDDLRPLMRDPLPVPFATGADAKPSPDRLAYPITLKISPFKVGAQSAMPPGDYKLHLTFEPGRLTTTIACTGGDETLHVMVPADTQTLRITPEGFRLRADTTRPSIELEARHFRRLIGARWRNVVLTHVNEWSRDVLAATLKARVKLHHGVGVSETPRGGELRAGDDPRREQTDREMDAFADALAWWNHREKPVTGSRDTPLFGGGAGALPAATDLEHVHPVTFAWALDLLLRHKKIEFVTPPRATPEASRETAYVGWVPATREPLRRRVGEVVTAVALSRGEANPDAVVTIKVKVGARSILMDPVGYRDGAASAAVTLELWGRASVGAEPSAPDAGVLGANVVEVARPQIGPLVAAPVRNKRGGYEWILPVQRHCPVAPLHGWVLLKTCKLRRGEPEPIGEAGYELFERGIPMCARAEPEVTDARGFQVEGGYYVRGPKKRGTHFEGSQLTYEQFCKAAPGAKPPAKIAQKLVEALEAFRKKRNVSGLVLAALDPAGLGVTVRIEKASARAKAREVAQALGVFESVADQGNDGVRVTVAAPPVVEDAHPGRLVVAFDPRSALAEVRAKLDPAPDEVVYVRFGAFFANGGLLCDRQYRESADPKSPVGDVTWARDLGADDRLDAWASTFSETVSRPGFGEPTCRYVGTNVSLSVPLLGGDAQFWGTTKPAFKVDGADRGGATRGGNALQVNLPMTTAAGLWNKTVAAVAVVRKNDVKFRDQPEHLADSAALSFSTVPSLSLVAKRAPDGDGEAVVLEVRANAMFGRGLRFTLASPGAAESGLKAIGKKLAAAHPPRHGGDDASDRFADFYVLRVAHSDLLRAMNPADEERTFEFKVEMQKPEGGVAPATVSVNVARHRAPTPPRAPIASPVGPTEPPVR
jgi:hypothetical protein